MEFVFSNFLYEFIVVYWDEITMFSNNRDDHVINLYKSFYRCVSLGISMSLKIFVFRVFEGKFFRHIVSKDGINIDPERVKDIVRPISNMLKKYHNLKWSDESKKAFTDIKQVLCQCSILIITYYGKEFQLFSFASDFIMAMVLLQKKYKGSENPIYFMNKVFQ
jgi:hypothetical protein